MICKDKQGRVIEVDGIEGEVSQGARVTSAHYIDNGKEISHIVANYINHAYADKLYSEFYQTLVLSGDYAYDGGD